MCQAGLPASYHPMGLTVQQICHYHVYIDNLYNDYYDVRSIFKKMNKYYLEKSIIGKMSGKNYWKDPILTSNASKKSKERIGCIQKFHSIDTGS